MTRSHARGLVLAVLAAWLGIAATVACSAPSPQPPKPDACPSDLPQSCDSPGPTWAAQVQPIIEGKCYPCHGEGGVEQPAFDYTTYAGVVKNRTTALQQVYACLMPPPDAAPLTSIERQTLLSWLGPCDAPND